MKFILGKKIGMTQVFLPSGVVVPVTKVQAGPCQIVEVKEKNKKNGLKAVQIGFDETKESRLARPQIGHLKDLDKVRNLKDFKIETDAPVQRGDTITVETFTCACQALLAPAVCKEFLKIKKWPDAWVAIELQSRIWKSLKFIRKQMSYI